MRAQTPDGLMVSSTSAHLFQKKPKAPVLPEPGLKVPGQPTSRPFLDFVWIIILPWRSPARAARDFSGSTGGTSDGRGKGRHR